MKTKNYISLLTMVFALLISQRSLYGQTTTYTCTPDNAGNWTGYCTDASKYDGDVRAGTYTVPPVTYVYNGWIIFNVASIPHNAIISNIVLNVVTKTAGASDHILFVKKMTVNPATATASVIFSDIYSSTVHYGRQEVIMTSTGSKSITLDNDAVVDLQSKVTAGTDWWAVGFRNQGDNDAYGAFEGHASINKPEIKVTCINPWCPQFVVTCSPNNTTYWTGSCTSSTKFDGDIMAGEDLAGTLVYNGWAAFNISAINSFAKIVNVRFRGNTTTAGGSGHILYLKKMTLDPEVATASAIFNDIYNSGVHFAREEIIMQATGQNTISLENTAITDLQSKITAGITWWAIGFRNKGDNDLRGIMQGHSQLKPEIIVTYTGLNNYLPEAGIANQAVIYPNPTGGMVNLAFPLGTNEISNLKVFNILGSVVFESQNIIPDENATVRLDLTGAKPGVYLLRAEGKNMMINKSIVIK